MREHQLIDIEKILVNPENPRHTQIMIADELFIMQQLVRNSKEAKTIHKLISDIYTNGWYPQSVVTVTYDESKEKFVAWDGNRRLMAMKILKNPKLVEKSNKLLEDSEIEIEDNKNQLLRETKKLTENNATSDEIYLKTTELNNNITEAYKKIKLAEKIIKKYKK